MKKASGKRYCFEAEYQRSVPTLFDLLDFQSIEVQTGLA